MWNLVTKVLLSLLIIPACIVISLLELPQLICDGFRHVWNKE